ncbi:MAG: FAD-binding oxidoreductase [Polyangiaceae bacterium]
MPKLDYEGVSYDRRPGESVLDALMRQGVATPFSCRKGVCLVCVMRKDEGELAEEASAGLREALRQKGYVLACKAVPEGDLRLSRARASDLFGRATVLDKSLLSPEVCRLRLTPATALYYHAGQFLNLRRPSDGLVRSYSIASVPTQEDYLEIHVRRVPFGRMSSWIFDELAPEDEVDIQGPEGRCYYRGDDPEVGLLLIGTGTGLAPLYGVARDALASGHRGAIHLYHGARERPGLYLEAELAALAAAHESFHYHPSLSGEPVEAPLCAGRASDLALADHPDLRGYHVFLCGSPTMVEEARRAAIEAGAPLTELRADPFETAALDPETTEEPDRYPPLDAEMWQALGEGVLLREILTDFYTQVYADPLLNPFFSHTTIDRSIGKQYSFLARVFAGDSLYFGDRPRNAHHWMVISDELFDHRAALMERVLRAHGLAEHLVRRFVAMEESYRKFIVKGRAWPRIMNGHTYPLEGYEEVRMDVGTLCDACQGEIAEGEVVRVHVRLGTAYCARCAEASGVHRTTTAPPPA